MTAIQPKQSTAPMPASSSTKQPELPVTPVTPVSPASPASPAAPLSKLPPSYFEDILNRIDVYHVQIDKLKAIEERTDAQQLEMKELSHKAGGLSTMVSRMFNVMHRFTLRIFFNLSGAWRTEYEYRDEDRVWRRD